MSFSLTSKAEQMTTLPANLKPNFECLNEAGIRQIASWAEKDELKKTTIATQAKDQGFNWQGYAISVSLGVAIGVFLSNNHH